VRVRRVERGLELSGVLSRERPDLVDLSLRIDPVEIETGHRKDLGRRGVRVLQDLARLRRFAEEVSAPFAGGEALRERALARAGLPREDTRYDRDECEKSFSPERQHPGSV
jgi:hypothetical protein